VPFVLILQSSFFDQYKRRLVAPLVLKKVLAKDAFSDRRTFPVFRIKAKEVVLNPLDIVSLTLPQIGPLVGSLADHGQVIQDSLDEVFSRSWG
jgi:toxin CcdB